jgi:hypothetical protein
MAEKIWRVFYFLIMESFRAVVYFCLIWTCAIIYLIYSEKNVSKEDIDVITFPIQVPIEIVQSKDCTRFDLWRIEYLPRNNEIACPWVAAK